MKTLFIGGIKSGKSKQAEDYILSLFPLVKPYYIATTELFDSEMQSRIIIHQQRRQNLFETCDAPVELLAVLKNCYRPALIECMTMWLNNKLYYQASDSDILNELDNIMKLPNDLVLVHNEVGLGIIPDNTLARHFVDLSGKAAQLMAQYCDEVYFCSAGLKLKMK